MSDPQTAAAEARPADQPLAVAELNRLRLKVFALSAENVRLQNTVSYQLGSALLRAKHWRGLLALPGEIYHLIAESRRRRGRLGDAGRPVALDVMLRRVLANGQDMPAEQILAAVDNENVPSRNQAMLLVELARIVRQVDPGKAATLMRSAVAHEPNHKRHLLLADMLYEVGAVEEPLAILAKVAVDGGILTQNAQQKLVLLGGMARIGPDAAIVPPRRARTQDTAARTLLYVAASSAAYHTSGYTSRTQALVKAIGRQGWTTHVATRPGYPQDRNDVHRMPDGPVQTIDGVTYTLLPGPKSNATAFDKYCKDASASILKQIETVRPTLVHAASNYLSATPALIAARRAGLPFVYEVRGLWELTQAAKNPRFEHSERFEWQRQRESQLAREADLVVTISNGLKSELVQRGVDENRIMVAPNCVDPAAFKPRKRDKDLARELLIGDSKVLGFIGSMTTYEGLVDLVMALARLRRNGHDVVALLVGDGPALNEVREVARSMDMQHHIILPGRVPHEEVSRWYSLMDLTVYPRRPSKVTELVPPLKPLEAMAMGLPVVASDVSAIRESVIDGRNGFLFKRGDVDSLTEVLDRVLRDPAAARKVARQGRADVKKLYTWDATAGRLTDAYGQRLAD